MKSAAIVLSVVLSVSIAGAATLEVVNNQPFPIKMPWRLHDGSFVMIDVAASARQSTSIGEANSHAATIAADPVENGIRLNVGTLSWGILLQKLDKKPTDKEA